MIVCKLCKEEHLFNTYKMLSRHLRAKHNYTPEQYYSEFYKKEGEGICKCGKPTKFLGIDKGYSKHCSCKCQAKYRDKSNNCFKNPEVQKRIAATKKANGTYYNKQQSTRKIKQVFEKYKELAKNEVEVLSYDGNDFTCKCKTCGKTFTTAYYNVYNRCVHHRTICIYCSPLVSGTSSQEKEIIEYLSTIVNPAEILTRDRTMLSNARELDIVLPNYKLAIEFDGLYWHSEEYKANEYHVNKTEDCEKNGFQLIHVFQDEWLDKQEIVKSRLKGLLHENDRIFARKCDVRQIDFATTKLFLDECHIQGSCMSKYNYGLYHNNELVSVMTFGKSRFSDNEFELLRFCNKLYTNVIGGASKLFQHFLKDHSEIREVTSYADRRWSIGNLYEKIGFTRISVTKPSYFYIKDGHRENRFNYQKHDLVKAGFDPSKTEHEIMLERKIYRIYDCGTIKYVYSCKQ